MSSTCTCRVRGRVSVTVTLLLAVLAGFFTHSHARREAHVATAHSTHGMMIDAGSDGSRIHVFSWDARVFRHFPIPLSIPQTSGVFTARIRPGIETFTQFSDSSLNTNNPSFSSKKHTHGNPGEHTDILNKEGLHEHLSQLINFAKSQLSQHRDSWSTFPMYLRATGSVRNLPHSNRTILLQGIRNFFDNKTACPFYTQFDSVRVLSGEEEAAFAWAGANVLHNTILPDLKDTETGDKVDSSHGAVVAPLKPTFGSVDLGATSSQIAFYVPSQDISEGLFKLQLGIYEHWNLYAKSFLRFGYDSARLRHMREIATETMESLDKPSEAVVPRALDYCFFAGYSEAVHLEPTDLGGKLKHSVSVEVHGPAVPAGDQMDRCVQSLRSLLRKDRNDFCLEAHDGECSMDGSYQPPLPRGNTGHFIGTSTYKYPWQFLQMPAVGSVSQFRDAASNICSKSFNDIVLYDATLTYLKTAKHSSLLPYYCFLTSYMVVLLEDGYGFTDNNTLSTQDEIKGNKVGWAYGAMLYEINSLPFKLVEPDEIRLLGKLLLAWSCGVVAGIIVVGGVISQFLYRPNQRASVPSEHEQLQNQAASSNFYDDLAKIYNGGSSSNNNGAGRSNGANSAGGQSSYYSGHITQKCPFTNRLPGEKETETSSLLAVKRHRGASSMDSNSSSDTVNVLKSEAMKNKNYQSMI